MQDPSMYIKLRNDGAYDFEQYNEVFVVNQIGSIA
jgi:hypothetical protein